MVDGLCIDGDDDNDDVLTMDTQSFFLVVIQNLSLFSLDYLISPYAVLKPQDIRTYLYHNTQETIKDSSAPPLPVDLVHARHIIPSHNLSIAPPGDLEDKICL